MQLPEKYEYILYWSAEDQVFVVEIPQLPGCSAHGNTQLKALKNAKQAAKLWIDTAKKLNREIPQPKGQRLMYA
jgi:predicted RNase H-like HicB family nuclease